MVSGEIGQATQIVTSRFGMEHKQEQERVTIPLQIMTDYPVQDKTQKPFPAQSRRVQVS